jgi:hypothetical protein
MVFLAGAGQKENHGERNQDRTGDVWMLDPLETRIIGVQN